MTLPHQLTATLTLLEEQIKEVYLYTNLTNPYLRHTEIVEVLKKLQERIEHIAKSLDTLLPTLPGTDQEVYVIEMDRIPHTEYVWVTPVGWTPDLTQFADDSRFTGREAYNSGGVRAGIAAKKDSLHYAPEYICKCSLKDIIWYPLDEDTLLTDEQRKVRISKRSC